MDCAHLRRNALELSAIGMNDDIGPFRDEREVGIRDDGRDLNDRILRGVLKGGHLKIHPDEEVIPLHKSYNTSKT